MCRSLQSIISKLDHGLLSELDLLQEKHLHIRLLEWFNFPSSVLHDKVLALILRLTKHSSAAQIYVDIGAVEFLSQLRPNVDSSLHHTIDSILDNLFHLPTTLAAAAAADNDGGAGGGQHECIYQHHQHTTVDSVFVIDDATALSNCSLLSNLSHQYISTQHGTTAYHQHVASGSQHGTYTSQHVGSAGYFAGEGQQSAGPDSVTVTIAARFIKFATFPWVALTPTDQHVLSSTNDSVRSSDVSMVVSVCEFLTDVVFQDFPAEVFLQRPSIVKNLLLLVNESTASSVLLSAVYTLNSFTAGLVARMKFHQDPSFYTARQLTTATSADTSTLTTATQSFSSSVDVPFIAQGRRRGDGQDVDTTTSSSDAQSVQGHPPTAANMDMIEQTDINDVFSLQFVQWTVPQFCFHVLENVVRCMHSRVVVDDELSMQCFELVHKVTAVLSDSLIPSALWQDTSLTAHELTESFHEVLEAVSKAVYVHHHSNLSPSTPSIELEQRRIVFMGLAIFTVELLDALVPRNLVLAAVPREFSAVLLTFCLDHTFATEFPALTSKSYELAKLLDEQSVAVYHELSAVCQSQTSTCQFLAAVRQPTDDNYVSLLQLAEDALPSLQYHGCLDVVDACVTLASSVCLKSSASLRSLEQSREILLTVLSHDVEAVRTTAHSTVHSIVKDALGLQLVSERPSSSSTLAAMFVLDAKVLYQLCCYGMADTEEIRELTEKTLLYFLQSQLLMSADSWQQLVEAICAVHAVIQSLCDSSSSSLGRCIIGLLETDPRIDTGTLPLIERLRGCLRLLFHSNADVRGCGAERSVKLLALEDSSSSKIPPLANIDLRRLRDFFIVTPPRTLTTDSSPSVCHASDVKKVYNIFISDSVEISVRRSAADQLAVVLADVSLHSVFSELGGISTVLDLLTSAVRLPEGSHSQRKPPLLMLIPALIKLVRKLTERDSSLRHRLAHQTDLYFTLFRCGLIHEKDEELRRDLSELFALLLFDEMTTLQEWRTGSSRILQPEHVLFSLPACIAQRYHLPFVTATHHACSPWSGKSRDDQSESLLRSGLTAEALRISWNVAWHDGIEETIDSKNCSAERYNERMSLSPMDELIMSTTHLSYALRHCIYGVNNATSHAAVSKALCRLRWYLVVTAPVKMAVLQQLNSLPWKPAVARFLTVAPSTGADEQLVLDIVKFLGVVVQLCSAGTKPSDKDCSTVNDVFGWIGEMLLNNSGALYHLLTRTDQSDDSTDRKHVGSTSAGVQATGELGRDLLQFVRLFISRCPYQLTEPSFRRAGAGGVSPSVGSVGDGRCVDGDLVRSVFARINRVDSVQSYNLPSLELSLLALMHATSRRGWSLSCGTADCLTLCLELLQTLLEVVSAFHAGRGGLLMSYMGRGITRCASVCLRHLAHEMATNLRSQEWPRNWLFAKSAAVDSVGQSGLHWLFPLWIYRDVEVRVAGVSIAAALTATEAGRITMATQCHNVPGGIWGAAFGLLFDATECSAVRQQAALLLVNLTSQSLPSDADMQQPLDTVMWQGPVVRNEETQVSLVGLPALLVLLEHLKFFGNVHRLISSLSLEPTVRPVAALNRGCSRSSVVSSSLNTMTTSVAMTPVSVSTALLVDLSSSTPQLDSWTGHQMSSSLLGQGHGDLETDTLRRRHVTGEGHNGDNATAAAAAALTGGVQCVSGQSSTAFDSDAAAAANDDSVHSSSSSSRHSVVTPGLVSAVCSLLSNLLALAPQDVSTALRNHSVLHVLMQTVEGCSEETVLAPTRQLSGNHELLLYRDIVDMYRHVVSLLSAVTVTDTECRRTLFDRQTTISSIITLLAVAWQPDNMSSSSSCCVLLWQGIFDMMTGLLQSAGQDTYIAITSSLVGHWKIVSGRLQHVIQDKSYVESELYSSALNFIALLCAEEVKFKVVVVQGHRRRDLGFPYISDCLDAAGGNEKTGSGSSVEMMTADGPSTGSCGTSSGSTLCRALVKCLDSVLLKPHQQFFVMKATVINALKSLLAISATAKTTALELGLLESLCEHVRHLHNSLSIDALDLSKLPASGKKKTNPCVTELILTFDLLRNFLFDCDEVKSCAVRSSLANLVHSVWCWSLTNPALMSPTLALLSAYTAHCPQACSSLASTTANGALLPAPTVSSSLGNRHSNNNSLCHCLLRLIQKETSSLCPPSVVDAGSLGSSVIRSAFQLAANLSLSPECRGVMWKSNFLHGFSALSPHKTKKGSGQLDGLWLSLFVNLSFSADGQTMILKIDGSLSLLVDYVSSPVASETHQLHALLILRNLCFHATNKPKLLAHDKLLPLLLQHVDSSQGSSQTIACSALLALAYNNHKAKGLLKTGQVVRRLRDAYNRLSSSSQSEQTLSPSTDSQSTVELGCSRIIHDLITLLR